MPFNPIHNPQDLAPVIDLHTEAGLVNGGKSGEMDGKSQTFLQNIHGIIFILIEKVNGIFPEGEAVVLEIMLRHAGKLDADDVIASILGYKLGTLGRKMENTVNILNPNVGKQHENPTS